MELLLITPGSPDFAILSEFAVVVLRLEDIDRVDDLFVLVPVDEDSKVANAKLVTGMILSRPRR